MCAIFYFVSHSGLYFLFPCMYTDGALVNGTEEASLSQKVESVKGFATTLLNFFRGFFSRGRACGVALRESAG